MSSTFDVALPLHVVDDCDECNQHAEFQTLKRTVALVERTTIEEALRRHRNNRTAAAKHLGVSRVTLYNKLKKYGMTV